MRTIRCLVLALILVAPRVHSQDHTTVVPIDTLDLDRYAGQWYEIARFPNEFQLKCVGDVTAHYTRLASGQFEVVNACRTTDGSVDSTTGRAKLAKKEGPTSTLKVRFAPGFLSWLPMVWGDYWVLDITDDYGAVLVGTPDREYLWMLARTPTLEDAVYDRLTATAQRQAFDVGRLVRTRQEP